MDTIVSPLLNDPAAPSACDTRGADVSDVRRVRLGELARSADQAAGRLRAVLGGEGQRRLTVAAFTSAL